MTIEANQLAVPDGLQAASSGAEVLRAWIVDGGLVVVLKPTIWPDGREWGILLADVAQHVGDALAREYGKDASKTVNRIKITFNTELAAPTSEREGSFRSEP
jgi:hypothetical protein